MALGPDTARWGVAWTNGGGKCGRTESEVTEQWQRPPSDVSHLLQGGTLTGSLSRTKRCRQ